MCYCLARHEPDKKIGGAATDAKTTTATQNRTNNIKALLVYYRLFLTLLILLHLALSLTLFNNLFLLLLHSFTFLFRKEVFQMN